VKYGNDSALNTNIFTFLSATRTLIIFANYSGTNAEVVTLKVISTISSGSSASSTFTVTMYDPCVFVNNTIAITVTDVTYPVGQIAEVVTPTVTMTPYPFCAFTSSITSGFDNTF
jgi:hypothetical protein